VTVSSSESELDDLGRSGEDVDGAGLSLLAGEVVLVTGAGGRSAPSCVSESLIHAGSVRLSEYALWSIRVP
jgi:hypothetical protein